MLRRSFLKLLLASPAFAEAKPDHGTRLAKAAKDQLGVTTSYDPKYVKLAYPGGDVPRTTGVCADVVVRAARDAFSFDLQRLVHEDMVKDFAAYPQIWGMKHADANIDHRRVLNLATYWKRTGACVWSTHDKVAGDDFPDPLQSGDLLTWLLDGKLPHVGVVVSTGWLGTRVVHNIGGGVQENALIGFRSHLAQGHFRWPTA